VNAKFGGIFFLIPDSEWQFRTVQRKSPLSHTLHSHANHGWNVSVVARPDLEWLVR
jgi:hypothetical protein